LIGGSAFSALLFDPFALQVLVRRGFAPGRIIREKAEKAFGIADRLGLVPGSG
jgi:hypothetical protein